MDNLKQILLIFVIYTAVQVTFSVRSVKPTNIQCTILDQSFGEFTKCSLKAVKRDVAELDIHVSCSGLAFPTSFSTNLAQINLRLAKRGDHKDNFLYQYTVDVCEFLRNSRRNPLAEIFYSFFSLQKYSNINHTCPYDHDLIVDRCRLNMKPLSALPLVQGDYKIYTTWVFFEKPVGNIDFTININ